MQSLNNLSGPTATQAQLDYNKANLKPTTSGGSIGDFVDMIATAARLPEIGFSEAISGGKMTTNTANPAGVDITGNIYNETPTKALSFNTSKIPTLAESGFSQEEYNQLVSGSNGYTSGDIAALQQNDALLRSLLGRLETGINQGKQTINSQYEQQLANSNLDKEKQLGTYNDQTIAQKTGREQQLGQVNQNANVGMNSLRNIIGRSSGSGSSVYKDLLPYLIGNDMSSNRRNIMNTTGTNIQNIDKAKNQYEADFAGVLQDLANQKKANEQNLLSGIEGQRQSLLQNQMTNAAQLAQAQGGGYGQVKSAIAPIQNQYDQSLNNVDSFFSQFQPTYTPNQKAAPTAELGTYTVDRADVNAADNTAGLDATNPYASLLRKKLTGEA